MAIGSGLDSGSFLGRRNRGGRALTPEQEVAALSEMPAMHAAFAWFRTHQREIADHQMQIAAIPAPPFGEAQRVELLKARFEALALTDVHIDAIGNVLGVRPGSDSDARFISVSAHVDTVFPSGTRLNVRREGERLLGAGISDNAAGLTAILSIAEALNEAGIRTLAPLVFIGNVGEEGEGDLRGFRHIFADPQWKDAIEYSIIVDGAGNDTVIADALGSRRFSVTIQGPGGHSWSDFGAPNPIVALARAIEKFSRTPLSQQPKTSFNVGTVSGGTSVNSIPQTASMRVDIRSASAPEIDRLEAALRDAVQAAVEEENGAPLARKSNGQGVRHQIEMIGSRPAAELDSRARILQVINAVDAQLDNQARRQLASTDANIPLAMGRQAIAIGGGGTGGGAHTLQEWYDPTGRDLGLKRILLTLLALAGVE